MGKSEKAIKVKSCITQGPIADTALDLNHRHYWGMKKQYKRYMIISCQICGCTEKRKVDWSKIPEGEVPEIELPKPKASQMRSERRVFK